MVKILGSATGGDMVVSDMMVMDAASQMQFLEHRMSREDVFAQ